MEIGPLHGTPTPPPVGTPTLDISVNRTGRTDSRARRDPLPIAIAGGVLLAAAAAVAMAVSFALPRPGNQAAPVRSPGIEILPTIKSLAEMPPASEDAAAIRCAKAWMANNFSAMQHDSASKALKASDATYFRIEYGPLFRRVWNDKLHPLFNELRQPTYDRYGNRAYEGGFEPVRDGYTARVFFQFSPTPDGFVYLPYVILRKRADETEWSPPVLDHGGYGIDGYNPRLTDRGSEYAAGRYWRDYLSSVQ